MKYSESQGKRSPLPFEFFLAEGFSRRGEETIIYLLPNGRHFSILLFTRKLALVASFKRKYSFEFRVKNEATRANLQEYKRILKWRKFGIRCILGLN